MRSQTRIFKSPTFARSLRPGRNRSTQFADCSIRRIPRFDRWRFEPWREEKEAGHGHGRGRRLDLSRMRLTKARRIGGAPFFLDEVLVFQPTVTTLAYAHWEESCCTSSPEAV